MNTLPTPDFLREGSLWDHIILIGRPLRISKFMVSKARSATIKKKLQYKLVSSKLIKNISVSKN